MTASAYCAYYVPISRGIFEHRKRIGAALWEFMYLLDRVTTEREENGAVVGLVANGNPVPLAELAAGVGCCQRTVRRNLRHLVKEGYIRVGEATGGASSYAVLNCKKFNAWGRTKVSREGGQKCPGREDNNVRGPRTEVSQTPDKSVRAYKESNSTNRRQYCRTDGSTPATSVEPEAKSDLDQGNRQDLKAALDLVWNHYLKATGRDGRTYSLTEKRWQKGMARLQDCLQAAQGDLSVATELMELAVDRLAASDWHMGRDPKTKGKRYCEWDTNLFGSVERMQKWWNE